MRRALLAAGVRPEDICYVEAHGTGTSLGDPIEVEAMGAVHASRNPERPLLIGSVKTNIGHLEAAAGVAGIVKIVLALQNANFPRTCTSGSPTRTSRGRRFPYKSPHGARHGPPGTNGAGRGQLVRLQRNQRARHTGRGPRCGTAGRRCIREEPRFSASPPSPIRPCDPWQRLTPRCSASPMRRLWMMYVSLLPPGDRTTRSGSAWQPAAQPQRQRR